MVLEGCRFWQILTEDEACPLDGWIGRMEGNVSNSIYKCNSMGLKHSSPGISDTTHCRLCRNSIYTGTKREWMAVGDCNRGGICVKMERCARS
ncbi:unnamed protein product [Leuciscus chuanchicus]